MIQKIDNATVREAVQQAYERCKNETGGKNADYIPYLANVPSTLFGIAACLPDGEVIAVGDTDYKFGIESVSKVPTAILAMNQYSAQEVLTKIGADATGLPFNSIMAILLENDHPSTPLVNAGAISACSMVQPVGDSDGKWKAITQRSTPSRFRAATSPCTRAPSSTLRTKASLQASWAMKSATSPNATSRA